MERGKDGGKKEVKMERRERERGKREGLVLGKGGLVLRDVKG